MLKRLFFMGFALLLGVQAHAQTVQPEPGMWYNPERSGHGFDLNFYGQDTLAVVWYTYDKQGFPIWYQAAATFDDDTWETDLYLYHWDGSAATPAVVGSIRLEFRDERHANLVWTIDYGSGPESGSEPVELLVAETDLPPENYSGHWFDQSEPGWGMTVGDQGNIEFVVLYFYDDAGNPTWALGAGELPATKAPFTLQMLSYRGFCPGCEAIVPTTEVIGSLTRDFRSGTEGTTTYNMQLSNGLSGSFARTDSTISRASDPITVEDLAAARLKNLLSLVASDQMFAAIQSINGATFNSSGNLNCPMVTVENGGQKITMDWGTGCTGQDGKTYSGKATMELQGYAATVTTITGQQTITWEDYRVDGVLMMDGEMVVTMQLSGSNGVYDGSIAMMFTNFYAEGSHLNGSVTMNVQGLNTLALSPDESFDVIEYLFDQFYLDGIRIDGTVTAEMQPSQPGDLYRLWIIMDVDTADGPVQGTVEVAQTGETRYEFDTLGNLTVGASQVVLDNVIADSSLCEEMPIAGTMSWTESGITYSQTFDDSCTWPPIVVSGG